MFHPGDRIRDKEYPSHTATVLYIDRWVMEILFDRLEGDHPSSILFWTVFHREFDGFELIPTAAEPDEPFDGPIPTGARVRAVRDITAAVPKGTTGIVLDGVPCIEDDNMAYSVAWDVPPDPRLTTFGYDCGRTGWIAHASSLALYDPAGEGSV